MFCPLVDVSGVLHVKVGYDGASSQKIYKQKFEDNNVGEVSKREESLFQTSMAPLKLIIDDKDIWINKSPGSTHFCRPLCLEYKKETTELIKQVHANLETEINNLKEYEYINNDRNFKFKIRYNVTQSMLDGKCINAVTDTRSTRTCNVCKATPKEMNDLDKIRNKPVDQNALKIGCSILHYRINTFAFVLHIGYKLGFEDNNYKVKATDPRLVARKELIQARFKEELSLTVDKPKPGFGSTNDGNTSRVAFANPEIFSEITGVDFDCIERLRNVLITLSSGYPINKIKFDNYCKELLVDKYPWYPTTSSVHWMLKNSIQIQEHLTLPIGVHSEEALEGLNKEIRKACLYHTAKISRWSDLIHSFQVYILLTTESMKARNCLIL